MAAATAYGNGSFTAAPTSQPLDRLQEFSAQCCRE